MENDDDMLLCPHCKKGKMREESAVVNLGIPNTGDRIVLICDLCGHRIAEIDHKETVKLDDKVDTEKAS